MEGIRLQDKLGKQNFHENIRKIQEPLIDTLKNPSKNLTKTLTESSIENKEAISNLNDKLSEIMNYRCIVTKYLLSPLSKITYPEKTTQFKLVRDSNSKRVDNLLIHNTRPVTFA